MGCQIFLCQTNDTGCRCHLLEASVVSAVADRFFFRINTCMTNLAACAVSTCYDLAVHDDSAADTGSLAIRVAIPAAPVTQQATQAPVPAPAPAATPEPRPAADTAPAAPTTPQIRIASIDEDTAAARETAAYSVINAMRISGIRGTGTDSRVLIDGRVYRINSVVDRTLGLRLTAVEADRLLFTDSRGTVFTRML